MIKFKSFVTAIFIFGASTSVWGGNEKLAREFHEKDLRGNIDVIVSYKQAPSDKQHEKVMKGGGSLKNRFDLLKSGHYSVPAAMLKDLADDPDVEFVSPNRPVEGMLDLTMAATNAGAAANYGLDGAGIGIAIIDSGVSRAYDLQNPIGSRVVYSQDFTGSGVTNDIYGHGTHVAGIAAGNGRTSSQQSGTTRSFVGVATRASIINLRVLDNNGQGTDSNVIAAINRAIALKSTYNIRVMNLSLGRPVYQGYAKDPLCQAVEAAWKAGIVVVVSAGNQGRNNNGGINGYGTISAPGNDPYVITVGAMKTVNTAGRGDDRIASYSSKGPTLYDHVVKPDIVAPGNQVHSILNSTSGTLFTRYPTTQLPQSYYASGGTTLVSTGYFTLSGTSMATPVVS